MLGSKKTASHNMAYHSRFVRWCAAFLCASILFMPVLATAQSQLSFQPLAAESLSDPMTEDLLFDMTLPNHPLDRPADVHALPEDISKLPTFAEQAYNSQNFVLAEKAYQALGEDYTDLRQWGLARIAFQQGAYSLATDYLADLYLRAGPYQEQARALHRSLLLVQAEIALIEGDLIDAQNFLDRYSQIYGQEHRQNNWYLRLQKELAIALGNQAPRKGDQPLKVGMLLPMAGNLESIGNDLSRAAQMALFDHSDGQMVLYPATTDGTPASAQQALQKLLGQNIDILLGPLLASEVEAIAPYARSAGVPLLAFSSDVRVAGDDTYLLSIAPQQQARLIARFAIENEQRDFAALVPNTLYGKQMLEAFKEELAAHDGASLVRSVLFDPNMVDLTRPLERLVNMPEAQRRFDQEKKQLEAKAKAMGDKLPAEDKKRLQEMADAMPTPIVDYEALFIPTSGATMPLIASQLAYFDTDASQVELLGSSLWHHNALVKSDGEYMGGAHFPLPLLTDEKDFEERFKRLYGHKPHNLAALAYDGVHLLTRLQQDGYPESQDLADVLYRPAGFHGLYGAYRFTPENITERGYNIVEVRGSRLRTVRNAPLLLPPLKSLAQKDRPTSSSHYQQEEKKDRWRGFFDFSLFGK